MSDFATEVVVLHSMYKDPVNKSVFDLLALVFPKYGYLSMFLIVEMTFTASSADQLSDMNYMLNRPKIGKKNNKRK